MRLHDLIQAVEKWSVERGLDKADFVKQAKKLKEEFGELVKAEIRADEAGLKDSIGDMLVVMIIYCQQTGLVAEEVLTASADGSRGQGDSLVAEIDFNSACVFMESVSDKHLSFRKIYLQRVFDGLYGLCLEKGLDLVECLALAYETIKDRKGKMVNGIFVKEEDLHD